MTPAVSLADRSSLSRLTIEPAAASVQGRARDRNEDRFHVDAERGILIIADGMGGHRAGEVASRLACESLAGHLETIVDQGCTHSTAIRERLAEAFRDTNELIRSFREEDPRFARMGTTAVASLLVGHDLYVASLGDSRLYLVRGNKSIRMTVDHSVAQGLADAGLLAPQQVRVHPFRNILHRYLGCPEFGEGVLVRDIEVRPNDWLVLTTDGLTDKLDDGQLVDLLRVQSSPEEGVAALIQAARSAGSTDDISCIVARVTPAPSTKTAAP